MDELSLKTITRVGAEIRRIRERLRKSLSEVSGEAGISVSMLSQIERGKVSPSIDTLMGVCTAMGIDTAEVFLRLRPSRSLQITRPGARLKISRDGATYEQLSVSRDPQYPMETFLLEIAPAATAGLSARGHEGFETGYVLTGEAVLTVGREQRILAAGDSVRFHSSVPHRLTNHRISIFRAVWSVSPPHVDYFSPIDIDRTHSAGEVDEQDHYGENL